jgi:hypothetical protein
MSKNSTYFVADNNEDNNYHIYPSCHKLLNFKEMSASQIKQTKLIVCNDCLAKLNNDTLRLLRNSNIKKGLTSTPTIKIAQQEQKSLYDIIMSCASSLWYRSNGYNST